ncbi:MAG: hypothetical protein RHS_1224 [Robinsoniella sp. RHS]|uniref:hypothetical protein n=1 Tax=Robinsoniella sp. RHS TaxID=1504536 RepID=UPI00064AAF08|nr:MAG: hypothetical protein RHS_1224 [Robinsoniella sp. RHS]
MVNIDIKNVETKTGYCFMGPIINAAIYYKRDYQLNFAGCLFFGFEPFNEEEGKSFYERMSWDFSSDLFPEELIKYHGLDVIIDKRPEFLDFKSIVDSELALGNPIVLTFDGYNAHWTYYYLKHKVMHFCLIVGVDEESESFLVIDPYFSVEIKKLPFNEVEQSYNWHYTIRLVEPTVNIASVWEDILKKGISGNYENKYNKSSYQMMREFAKEILQSNDIIEEMKIQDSAGSYQILEKMKYITFSRLNFSWFLEYIIKEFSVKELEPMVKVMVQLSDKWNLVFGQLTKLGYLKQEDAINRLKKKIYDQIVENSEIEEDATKKMMKILQDKRR